MRAQTMAPPSGVKRGKVGAGGKERVRGEGGG